MQDLSEKYIIKLQKIATDIQNSEPFAVYAESEEEEDYKSVCDVYEPQIAKVYQEIAANDPLQIEAAEKVLINDYFEGLYLPRILGFSILRGQVNDQTKYVRPQNHFKEILKAILESAHFENLKKRIGQTTQIGFALSSDIWITDFISEIPNKRIRYYLMGNKLDKYRDPKERHAAYSKYKAQFSRENYLTAIFPANFSELKVEYPELKNFLLYRIANKYPNTSLLPFLVQTIKNETFFGTIEHVQLLCLAVNFFKMSPADEKVVKDIFNKMRKDVTGFSEKYLSFIIELHDKHVELDSASEIKASGFVDGNIKDDVQEYYRMTDIVHTQGYNNPDVMNVVKVFYDKHEGLSVLNESLRRLVGSYINRLISKLSESEYPDYFEASKIFASYMRLFDNEHFNQSIRDASIKYTNKCFVKFTDKRGKEYQEVKRFVKTNFTQWHFMKEKDVTEMFKNRRKKKGEK